MSADVLRRAATLMRERAEACIGHEPMTGEQLPWYIPTAFTTRGFCDPNDAAHMAAWSPDVALAVADWLDREVERAAACTQFADGGLACGDNFDSHGPNGYRHIYRPGQGSRHALAVARAYLGESA